MDTYTITPNDKGGFTVQVKYGTGGIVFQDFGTETEAQAWIARQKLAADALNPAGRP